ncbi:MAG: START domain-containing protein [Rugosibacter sp.]|nr:START domain-containing protein [Rugosibacter sp.]
MHFARTVVLSVSLAFVALVAHAEPDWRPVKQAEGREGINTWARTVEGMAVKEFKGVTEVHASILSVMSLMNDIPNLPSWVFNCRLAERPVGTSKDHRYMQFNGIWPASDRDVLVKVYASQQNDHSISIITNHVDGYAERDGFVRMPYVRSSFRITPLKDGWTKVEYETRVDLGGLVPAWLAGMVSTKAPFVTLEGLQREIKQAKYQTIKSPKELTADLWRGAPMVVPEGH